MSGMRTLKALALAAGLALLAPQAVGQTYIRDDQDHVLRDNRWKLSTEGSPVNDDMLFMTGTLRLRNSPRGSNIIDPLGIDGNFLDLSEWGTTNPMIYLVAGGSDRNSGTIYIAGHERAGSAYDGGVTLGSWHYTSPGLIRSFTGIEAREGQLTLMGSRPQVGGDDNPNGGHRSVLNPEYDYRTWEGSVQVENSSFTHSKWDYPTGENTSWGWAQPEGDLNSNWFKWPTSVMDAPATAIITYQKDIPFGYMQMAFQNIDPNLPLSTEWVDLECQDSTSGASMDEDPKNNFLGEVFHDADPVSEPSKIGCVSRRVRTATASSVTVYLPAMRDEDGGGDTAACTVAAEATVTMRVRYVANGEDWDDAAEQTDTYAYSFPCAGGTTVDLKTIKEGDFTFATPPAAGDYIFLTFEIDHDAGYQGDDIRFWAPSMVLN